MTKTDKIIKRIFDLILSIVFIFIFWWLIILLIVISTIDTKQFGVFVQKRIGYKARSFKIYKIRTMTNVNSFEKHSNTERDKKVTKFGKLLRKAKLDELPQILNILKGEMSFVGPRPDISGFADTLSGKDKIILTVKPGLTGPASIKFKNEEQLLAFQNNPEYFNKNIIWPEKVAINKIYIENYSIFKDIKYIIKTVF